MKNKLKIPKPVIRNEFILYDSALAFKITETAQALLKEINAPIYTDTDSIILLLGESN